MKIKTIYEDSEAMEAIKILKEKGYGIMDIKKAIEKLKLEKGLSK